MSTRSFASLYWVTAIAGAALGCYLVSLRVAAERAELEAIENRIVLAQRDIRLLQTEIGARGRLAQLERWNVKVLALSAPTADQFLDGSFELAKLVAPPPRQEVEAPVVLASAPAPRPKPAIEQQPVDDSAEAAPVAPAPVARLLNVAGLKRPAPASPAARAAPGKAASELLHTASLKSPARESARAIATEPGPDAKKPVTAAAGSSKSLARKADAARPPASGAGSAANIAPKTITPKTITAKDPLAPR